MKLSFDEVKKIVTGAARIEEENGAVKLFRFTREQEELYKITSRDEFYIKSFVSAGIKLLFKTDSKSLFLKVTTEHGKCRNYFSIDVFVNGNPIGYLDNFSEREIPQNCHDIKATLGQFSKSFSLGEGEKNVCVHLPWSVITSIDEIGIDDGAYICGIKPAKKLLAFGDSITQGYDALRPSNRYIAKLADKLGTEEFNKAIGGEKFFPELAELEEAFAPDYITVAYGTNDWNRIDEQTFKEKSKAFFTNIRKTYPEAKIFAITPIWRKDFKEERVFGAFEKVEEDIREAVKEPDNITVISGFDFVPKDELYFADLRLHPNDNGFEYYFKNLYNQIKAEL